VFSAVSHPIAGPGRDRRWGIYSRAEIHKGVQSRQQPTAAPLHPVLVRLREDKTPNEVDIRFSRIVDWLIPTEEEEATDLPKSELLGRDVWTKVSKGKVAIRKLVVWKTNKEQIGSSYPAYVVHWTDYAVGRKKPLGREVRLAMIETDAVEIADNFVEANIKKGWRRL